MAAGQARPGRITLHIGVPGPRQTTWLPSPIVQVTMTGTAVAVADSLGTDAVADRGPQVAGSTQSHVGTFTI